MTAQLTEDPSDPLVIPRALPDREREEFLRQYHLAVDAAHDPDAPTVTAANLKRARTRPGAEPLKVAAVHRIEQPRHRGQPLALAFAVMIKDVWV